jgi:hypothetical protein
MGDEERRKRERLQFGKVGYTEERLQYGVPNP